MVEDVGKWRYKDIAMCKHGNVAEISAYTMAIPIMPNVETYLIVLELFGLHFVSVERPLSDRPVSCVQKLLEQKNRSFLHLPC